MCSETIILFLCLIPGLLLFHFHHRESHGLAGCIEMSRGQRVYQITCTGWQLWLWWPKMIILTKTGKLWTLVFVRVSGLWFSTTFHGWGLCQILLYLFYMSRKSIWGKSYRFRMWEGELCALIASTVNWTLDFLLERKRACLGLKET